MHGMNRPAGSWSCKALLESQKPKIGQFNTMMLKFPTIKMFIKKNAKKLTKKEKRAI
jgi:hypothetical protein